MFPVACKGLGTSKGKSMHAITERLTAFAPGAPGAVSVSGPYSGYSLHGPGGIQVVLPEQGTVLGRATLLSPTAVWALPGRPAARCRREIGRCGVCLDAGGHHSAPCRARPAGAIRGGRAPPSASSSWTSPRSRAGRSSPCWTRRRREGRAEPEVSPLPVRRTSSSPSASGPSSKSVCAMKQPGRAAPAGPHAAGDAGVLGRREPRRCTGACAEPGAEWGEAPYDIEVVGYNSAYRMRVAALDARGDWLVTPLPQRLWRVRHRWHRRVPRPRRTCAPASTTPCGRSWARASARSLDVSFSGPGPARRRRRSRLPGPALLPLELERRGRRAPLPEWRGAPRVGRAAGWAAGVRPAGAPAHAAGRGAVDAARLPGALPRHAHQRGAARAAVGPVADSGYFNLAGRSAGALRGSCARASSTRASARRALPQLFCQTVWPSERGVEATLSSVQAPTATPGWCTSSARRPGSPPTARTCPGQILRDIYLRTLEHAQGDPEFRWLLSLRRVHRPLLVPDAPALRPAACRTAGRRWCMPVRMMEVECDEPSGQPADGPGHRPGPSARSTCWRGRSPAPARPATSRRWTSPASAWSCGTRPGLAGGGAGARAAHAGGAPRGRAAGRARARAGARRGRTSSACWTPRACSRSPPRAADAYVALLDEARRWFALPGPRLLRLPVRGRGRRLRAGGPAARRPPARSPACGCISARLLPEFLEHVSEATVGRRLRPPRPNPTRHPKP